MWSSHNTIKPRVIISNLMTEKTLPLPFGLTGLSNFKTDLLTLQF